MLPKRNIGLILARRDLAAYSDVNLIEYGRRLDALGVHRKVLVTYQRVTVPGWRVVWVDPLEPYAHQLLIAEKHCPNCTEIHIVESMREPMLDAPQIVVPPPFVDWAPARGVANLDASWQGVLDAKPWDYACEVSIPVIDAWDTLPLVIELLRAQTVKPFITLIDCGSTPEQHDWLEALRADDLEIHTLRFNAVRHPSDFPAIACDLAFSMCRSEVSVMTHSDVFLRRRDALEELVGLCTAERPAVGYQMTPREHAGWEDTVSHTFSAFHMPTMWKIGGGWSLARLCARRGIGHYPNSALRNMPDTEILLSDILRENGIRPYFIGTEQNEVQTVDDRIRHVRSLSGARLYSPAHKAVAESWLAEALAEAAVNIAEWTRESEELPTLDECYAAFVAGTQGACGKDLAYFETQDAGISAVFALFQGHKLPEPPQSFDIGSEPEIRRVLETLRNQILEQ